ncbi:MAG: ketoacyl-ACP synthase III [Parachlamydiaceae bacterium]|nr:ketoacyl-ACP synthase III [Parachlamydiaceae bacterium]
MVLKRTKARIIGLGSYLPEHVLTNQDLEKMVETSDEWIVSRTGMKERRIADKTEFSSDMGVAAARQAIKNAKIDPNQIDLILVATMTPDYISPSTAAIVQSMLDIQDAAAMDVQAACTGFLYGLSIAKAYIDSGIYRNILLVASEKMSSFIDYSDRNTCVLFGDGAAAAIISDKGAGLAIDNVNLGADGSLAELLFIPGGGTRNPATCASVGEKMHYIKMNGRELFKHAVRRMSQTSITCLEQAGLTKDDISWLIPHQANERIIDVIAKGLELPLEKVFKTMHKYGNTSASSIAIALDELTQQHKIKQKEHLLLVAFGAGLTWGAVLLTQRSR